jgi:hypothetical protein
MLKYFDKTFFKFTGGFIAIILVSILILAVTDYKVRKAEEKALLCCSEPLEN